MPATGPASTPRDGQSDLIAGDAAARSSRVASRECGRGGGAIAAVADSLVFRIVMRFEVRGSNEEVRRASFFILHSHFELLGAIAALADSFLFRIVMKFEVRSSNDEARSPSSFFIRTSHFELLGLS